MRKFVDCLIATNFNKQEAGFRAGYIHRFAGYRLMQREDVQKAVDERLKDLRDTLRMSAEEVLEGLTEVARDKGHKDRLSALDKLARVHGLYSESIPVAAIIDRNALLTAAKTELARLTGGTVRELPAADQVVEAQIVPSADRSDEASQKQESSPDQPDEGV